MDKPVMHPARKCLSFLPLLCTKRHCRFCNACGIKSGIVFGDDIVWYCPECYKFRAERQMTWSDMVRAYG